MGNHANSLYIKAKIGSLESNQISIDDLYYHWNCLSNDGHWTLPTGFSFSNDGITMDRASTSATSDITFPSNVEMEVDMSYSQFFRLLPVINAFNPYAYYDGSTSQIVLRDNDDPNAWNNRTEINNKYYGTGKLTIRIENNVATLIEDNVTLGSKNMIGTTKSLLLTANSSSDRKYTVKEIKVRQL